MNLPRQTDSIRIALVAILAAGAAALGGYTLMTAADHEDAPLAAPDQPADIADVYAFRSPTNPDNVVLALTVGDLNPPAQIQLGRSIFDPDVLYQLKLDNDGDAVEDLVIQAFVSGNPGNQVMHFRGPVAPDVTGAQGQLVNGPESATVRVSTGLNPIVATRRGMTVFAGVREDPFFFDLGRFSAILAGAATSFNDPGTDAFEGLNAYAIVVELPIAAIGDPAATTIWATTNRL